MREEVYQPYFISNHTILAFENLKNSFQLVSLEEIIRKFQEHSQQTAKYYFIYKDSKVRDNSWNDEEFSRLGSIKSSLEEQNRLIYSRQSDNLQPKLSSSLISERHSLNSSGTFHQSISEMQSLETKYIQIELRKIQAPNNQFIKEQHWATMEANQNLILVEMREITQMMKSQ